MANRPGRTPQSPNPVLDHFHTLTGAALIGSLLFVAGLLAGSLLALWLCRRKLSWTWSLLSAAPLSVLGLAVAGGAQSIVWFLPFAAGFAAVSIGLSLHADLEDRRAGGDRETAARSRRSPLDQVRSAYVERRSRRETLLEDGVPIGRTHRGELASIPRGSAEAGRHILVPGATGAGKTTSLAAILVDYVARNDISDRWSPATAVRDDEIEGYGSSARWKR